MDWSGCSGSCLSLLLCVQSFPVPAPLRCSLCTATPRCALGHWMEAVEEAQTPSIQRHDVRFLLMCRRSDCEGCMREAGAGSLAVAT